MSLIGCSSGTLNEAEQANRRLSQELMVSMLLRRCPQSSNEVASQFVLRVGQRLMNAQAARGTGANISLKLIECQEPLSFVAPSNTVLISTGMLSLMPSEASLAFLLAHEFSHIFLGHLQLDRATDDGYRQEDELDADKHALYLIITSHYHPWASIEILSQPAVFSHAAANQQISTHPKLQERVITVRKLLGETDWQPPGTVSSRGFNRMMAALHRLPY